MQQKGVFGITKEKNAFIVKTKDYISLKDVEYATQSGPMLVVDGKINDSFKENSCKVNYRNGVGVLPDNKVIFAISSNEVNLYQFADFFIKKGCKNALYLDGYISKIYSPENNKVDTTGNFSVIIAVSD